MKKNRIKPKSRLPKTYRAQPGCHDCAHVFIMKDWDEGPAYYCTAGAPPRPRCGSSLMDERFGERGCRRRREKWNQGFERWDRWSSGREVEPWYTCDKRALWLPSEE